jgi:hypothetical protein
MIALLQNLFRRRKAKRQDPMLRFYLSEYNAGRITREWR